MKLYKITNFVIVLLVVTAIIQTGELWLQGTDSHNFFYSVMERLKDGGEQTDGDVLLATRYAAAQKKESAAKSFNSIKKADYSKLVKADFLRK